jgi:uncharacterized membrane protein
VRLAPLVGRAQGVVAATPPAAQHHGSETRSWLREPWLLALVAAAALLDGTYSILRHVHLASGLDLAIFDQAVWHYSQFQAPFSSIKGIDLLGDHFHPLVAILAPLYWIWSDPRMLLVAQSLLVAASAIPVFLFARDRIGRGGALLLSVAYISFWGIQVGVGFDFHEVAFAPLLIACLILSADRESWRRMWVAALLLLAVKEDLSLFVAFFGFYLLTGGHRRQGALLIAIGIGWFELATKIFIPHFGGGVAYAYWSYGELGRNLWSATLTLITHPWRVFTIGLAGEKGRTTVALLAPFLGLSLCSRVFLLAVPLLLERMLSTDQQMWGTSFHYSLAIAPVLAMAAAAGLANVTSRAPRLSKWVPAATVVMVLANVALTLAVPSNNPFRWLRSQSFYTNLTQVAAAKNALAQVPNGVPLATIDALLPHASERKQILLITPGMPTPEFLLAPVGKPYTAAEGVYGPAALGEMVASLLKGMTPFYYNNGWLVARKPPAGAAPTNGVLVPIPRFAAAKIQTVAGRWAGLFFAGQARLSKCSAPQGQRPGPAQLCNQRAMMVFDSITRLLMADIQQILPSLRGGCRQLVELSLSAVAQLEGDLTGLQRAVSTNSERDLIVARSAVVSAEQDKDLLGIIGRTLSVCEPRG